MRISDWSSDVCSSDLPVLPESERLAAAEAFIAALGIFTVYGSASPYYHIAEDRIHMPDFSAFHDAHGFRSEEHTSELQSLMPISYAVFCLKKKILLNHTRFPLRY